VKNPVANRELRVPFTFGIGYEDDIDQAREIILEEARTVDLIETDPEPNVIVTELGDSAVGLVGHTHYRPEPREVRQCGLRLGRGRQEPLRRRGYRHALPLHGTHRHARCRKHPFERLSRIGDTVSAA
jgi:hypothetical protein